MENASGTAERERATARGRRGALADVFRVLVRPMETFERLVTTPRFAPALIFVMSASMASAVYAVRGGFMDEFFRGMALRSGAEPGEIATGFLFAGVLLAVLVVPVISLIETLFYMLAGRIAGGTCRFMQAFAAVCYSSVPLGIGALFFAVLMPVTNSPRVGANLAFIVDPEASPLLWSFARQLDLFAVWFFALLAVAAVPLFGLPRGRARLAAMSFAVVYVAAMTLSGTGDAKMFGDPYASWGSVTSQNTVLLFPLSMPSDDVERARVVLDRAHERCAQVAGAIPNKRIECYLYTSLEHKSEVTGNADVGHGVPWAGVLHLALTETADLVAVREMMQVVALPTLGKVYNPLINEGLAIYAGGVWGGEPVRKAAGEMLDTGALPSLERLTDRYRVARIDPTLAHLAAGAFFDFLVAEHGLPAFRDFYSAACQGDDSIRSLIEEAYGDSLSAMDRRWRAYLGHPADVVGEPAVD